jgi:transglutaminase-like putative cysteine protease
VLFVRLRNETHHVETLEEFAAELPGASHPSPATYTFVASVDERLTADEKLAQLYASLKERWQYVPDPAGQDAFEKAEVTLSSQTPKGDCEDFAAAMVSISKALNLTHRVWLGESPQGGHVWVEIYVTRKSELDPRVRERLLELFQSSAEIAYHADGIWLRLATPGALNSYRPTHYN